MIKIVYITAPTIYLNFVICCTLTSTEDVLKCPENTDVAGCDKGKRIIDV
jgi:hypothetical protein